MAYMDTSNAFAIPTASSDRGNAVSFADVARSTFTALEWSVIALARRDSLASLKTPGRVARAMGSLFGRGTQSRLADPKLEALRRLAIHAWRRGFALPVSELEEFVAAGLTMDKAEILIASVAGDRIAPPTRRKSA
ncbi:hypothetical protein [Sphingomonas sp.]|uniref:hypothetical protein n=1 Tax=Sphingomonas sp. TaxID=28214 RepID=UPI0025F28A4D|nr:hypothetical protein [Sphingomonas sp.]